MSTRIAMVVVGLAARRLSGVVRRRRRRRRCRSRPRPVRPAGAQEITDAPDGGERGLRRREASLRPGPQPRRRAPCRRVRRWRPSPSADGSSSASTRTPSCSASAIPFTGAAGGLRHRPRPRDRAPHLRRSRPHRSAGGRSGPAGVGVASPVRSTWWSGPTRSPATASRTSTSPRRTSTPTRRSSRARDPRIDSAADLSGKRVCAVSGHDVAEARCSTLEPRPTLVGVTSWTDCLLMLQQGQVDAISTDDVGADGPCRDRTRTSRWSATASASSPTASGSRRRTTTWFDSSTVCSTEMRDDGTWERLYDRWLRSLGPSPGPPDAAVSGLTMTMTPSDRRELAPTKEVAHVGETGRAGEPSRPRARAPLSADGRDRAAMGGDRDALARLWDDLADDVDPGSASCAGAILARRRRPTSCRAAPNVAQVPGSDVTELLDAVESSAATRDRMRRIPAVAEFSIRDGSTHDRDGSAAQRSTRRRGSRRRSPICWRSRQPIRCR